MKNYEITSAQIPHLVRLTADIFRQANENIDFNDSKPVQMHFVVDLLKELVDTAYPIENDTQGTKCESNREPSSKVRAYENYKEKMTKSGLRNLIVDFETFTNFFQAIEDANKDLENIDLFVRSYKPLKKDGDF